MNQPAAFPGIQSPISDPKTGRINQAWFQLLVTLWNRTGGGTGSTDGVTTNFWAATATGDGSSIILSISDSPPSGYSDGQRYVFRAFEDNPGAVVASVNGFGGLPVLKANDQPLQGDEILSGHYYELLVQGNESRFTVGELMPQSPQEILRQLLSVDGSTSGLNVQFLQGLEPGDLFLGSQIFGG